MLLFSFNKGDKLSTLNEILKWTEKNGDERAIPRLRMLCLSTFIAEKIKIDEVTDSTTCSDECLKTVREAAEKIANQPCPL